ncbi:unnamed protein product [Phytophthora fragariaefolia]|uniref:Unnamed protein product n=1 Tax=Phytophthora fragariaefolia TaxID=1490495 RepID=A0A9W6TS68_9STRA|nr:unnamed protein product [Phytophthora fragariaefolia]
MQSLLNSEINFIEQTKPNLFLEASATALKQWLTNAGPTTVPKKNLKMSRISDENKTPSFFSCTEAETLHGPSHPLVLLKDTAAPRNYRTASPNSENPQATGKHNSSSCYNTGNRRLQCRVNQARYRDRKRAAEEQLGNDVTKLRQEVNSLKRIYRDLSSRERNSHSPWGIVVEVFHLLESSFRSPWCITSTREMMSHPQTGVTMAVLKRAFVHDAAMGDLCGVEALMEQLRLYSQCFGGSRLRLKRIESVSADVMAARAELGVTVTEVTLKHAFPHFLSNNYITTT